MLCASNSDGPETGAGDRFRVRATDRPVRMKPDWSVVGILLIVVLAVVPAAAQIPLVSLRNASRPGRDLRNQS